MFCIFINYYQIYINASGNSDYLTWEYKVEKVNSYHKIKKYIILKLLYFFYS